MPSGWGAGISLLLPPPSHTPAVSRPCPQPKKPPGWWDGDWGGTVPRLGSSAPPAKAEPSPGPGSAQPRPRHLSQLISFNSAICQSSKSPWSWLIFFPQNIIIIIIPLISVGPSVTIALAWLLITIIKINNFFLSKRKREELFLFFFFYCFVCV